MNHITRLSHVPLPPSSSRKRSYRRRYGVGVAAALVVLAACGGGGGDSSDERRSDDESEETEADRSEDSEAPKPTRAPTTAPPAAAAPTTVVPAGTIASFQDVQPAVVQIVAAGSFRNVEDGETYTGYGSGTGFIISPDGIAVTNNHVVTGAATLEVFVGGDTSKSFNAKVLGVSECNDLAVIDINESEPLPTLSWSDAEVRAGLSVYAAGFPLGDPEFTLTSGIVGKVDSAGDMPWASIDGALEHDAVIQPGNSGGPLVGEDGRVVAVNYAFKGGVTANRFQSIKADLAIQVTDMLRNGDFESLGINGEAYANEETGDAGVWVAGVAPGSPASKVGLLPGDIITSMNGLPVGQDGTMAAYCDVIRTAGAKPIALEVLRWDTAEFLAGEIGTPGKPLVATFSFSSAIDDAVAADTGSVVVTGYETVIDDLEILSVELPIEWADRNLLPEILDDGTVLPQITASPNLDGFVNGYDVPGLLFTTMSGLGVDEVLLSFDYSADCLNGGIDVYEDAVYTGKYQVWTDCGDVGSTIIVIGAISPDWSDTAILLVQATSDADLEVLDRAFDSFVVFG